MSRSAAPARFAAIVTSVAALVLASAGQSSADPGPDPSRFTVAGAPTLVSQVEAAKSATGRIAKSDPALLKRTDAALVNVMVKLDLDPVASYTGGVKGLAATSPAVTNKPMKSNKAAVAAYTKHANAVVEEATPRTSARPSRPPRSAGRSDGLRWRVDAAAGEPGQGPAGGRRRGRGAERHARAAHDRRLTRVPRRDGRLADARRASTAGEGVIVGVLDTGIWPEHPSFADPGIDAPARRAVRLRVRRRQRLGSVPTFACNDKLIGAHVFLDTYLASVGAAPGEFCNAGGCSARDDDGHGTHTASTAAGNPVASADRARHRPRPGLRHRARRARDRLPGLRRPRAASAPTRSPRSSRPSSTASTSSTSRSAAARTPTPTRSSWPSSTPTPPGVFVAASAGNDGPGAGTADHGGPWVTTVGASTPTGTSSRRSTLTADGGATPARMVGSTAHRGRRPAPRSSWPSQVPATRAALCPTAVRGRVATGKIVVCQRGVNGRVEKGFNVLARRRGRDDPVQPDRQRHRDRQPLPARPCTSSGPDADLLAFLGGHTGVTATWAAGETATAQGDVMAALLLARPAAATSSSPTSPRPACRSSPGTPRPR